MSFVFELPRHCGCRVILRFGCASDEDHSKQPSCLLCQHTVAQRRREQKRLLVSGVSGLGKMYFRFSKFRILMENPVLLTKSSDSRELSPRLVLVVLSLECCSPWKDSAGTEFKVIKLLNTGLTGLLSYEKCILHLWARHFPRKKHSAAEAQVCSFKASPNCDFIVYP